MKTSKSGLQVLRGGYLGSTSTENEDVEPMLPYGVEEQGNNEERKNNSDEEFLYPEGVQINNENEEQDDSDSDIEPMYPII